MRIVKLSAAFVLVLWGLSVLVISATADTPAIFTAIGRVVQDEGSTLTRRAILNFIGAGVDCVDNGGSVRTDCTISGTGGTDSITSVELDMTDDYTWTGAHDFGGGTALEVPNSDSPTVDEEGEVAIDTDPAGVAADQFVYFDGVAARALSDVITECKVIENLKDTDDDMPFFMNTAYTDVTILSAACSCIGTCTNEADLTFEVDSGSVAALTGTVQCETPANATNQTLDGGEENLDQFEVLRFDVTGTAPDPLTDTYIICVNYRPVRQ